jgi:hypothetical protein
MSQKNQGHFPCGFISIKMAKIVVGSPSLTQPLLLYPGLGQAMLEQQDSIAPTTIKDNNKK